MAAVLLHHAVMSNDGVNHPETGVKRLNLGCGRYPKAGFVNVDIRDEPQVDVVHNLSVLPYPFEDASFDEIEADHLLEHLTDVFGVMRELHRILKPGGRLTLRVPHFSRGFTHSEHARGFDAGFPYYFNPDWVDYYGPHFNLESMRLQWWSQPYLKTKTVSKWVHRTGTLIGKVIDFAANIDPLVTSRLWCFYVGGFEQIEYVFQKPLHPSQR